MARRLKAERALIVTDAGVAAAGLVEPVKRTLADSGLPFALFEGIDPNPTEANVESGLEVYRRERRDLIVAVGGGGALDGGKAIPPRAAHCGALRTYDEKKHRGA